MTEKTDLQIPKQRIKITPWWKEILLTIVNITLVILTFIYLTKLPEKAKIAKEKRNSLGISSEKLNIDLAKFEVETSREKFAKLDPLFPNQKELIDFIAKVDKLKTDAFVTYFSFASETVVKDRTGYPGYPFVIEFEGTLTQVSDGLEKLSKLPYMFKPINISIEQGDKENTVNFKYGGFLYVDETTQKN